MRTLSELVLKFSRSWKLFVTAVVLTFGSLSLFTGLIAPRFTALTGGSPPFDLQNRLTVAEVYDQLAAYPEAARRLYYAFSAVDFAFPVFASLFLGGLAAFALRALAPQAFAWATARRLWALFLLPAAFDWAENVFALTIVANAGTELRAAAAAMILAKLGKLSLIVAAQLTAWGLALAAACAWLYRRARP